MSEETKYSAAAMRAAEAIQEHRQWKGGAISTVELAQIIDREYQTQNKICNGEPLEEGGPTLDATDGACPAWWRGVDHGIEKANAELFSNQRRRVLNIQGEKE